MSADDWKECPICKKEYTVKVYYIWDYDLTPEGKIIHHMEGKCIVCGKEFK